MSQAVFRRIAKNPMTLRINGVPTKLNQGDEFTADYDIVNGLPGMQFVRYTDDAPQNFIPKVNGIYTILEHQVPPTPTYTQEVSFLAPEATEPPDDTNAQKDCPKCKGKGKYSFGGVYGGTVHWSVCECIMTKVITPNPEMTIGFEPDTLKMLKAKTPREWMLVKKHELKKIMDEAGIDYSQVKDERMDLYKFLFSIIKQL